MDFVCFGGEDWWYHNRGHIDMQLMRRFARKGTTLYINSIVMQKLSLGARQDFGRKFARKVKSILKGLKRSDAGFWVYSPLSLPVHHIKWLSPVNKMFLRAQVGLVMHKLGIHSPTVWVACPVACDVAVEMRKRRLVYQRTDRYEEFPNVDSDTISQYDRKLKASADLTVFVNALLYEQERHRCTRALLLDHGVDYDIFVGAERCEDIPDDMKDVTGPIAGLFGTLDDHKFDIDLLTQVADLLPEFKFVLIGRASMDCTDLLSRKNVTMLGQKPYEQIPHYGKCFDVAIIPWKQSRWVDGANPIKLKEYLALGKPIVSTPFPELEKYLDVVYQAETAEQFANCIKKAYSKDSPELMAKRRQKIAHASWDSKADVVLQELFPEGDSDAKFLDGPGKDKIISPSDIR